MTTEILMTMMMKKINKGEEAKIMMGIVGAKEHG